MQDLYVQMALQLFQYIALKSYLLVMEYMYLSSSLVLQDYKIKPKGTAVFAIQDFHKIVKYDALDLSIIENLIFQKGEEIYSLVILR
jgi:hypothetical protein